MLFTLAEATALETPDLYANLQMNLPEMGKIEEPLHRKSAGVAGFNQAEKPAGNR